MGIFNKIFGNKAVTTEPEVYASREQTSLFLNGLIDSYADKFVLDNAKASLMAYETIDTLNTVIKRSSKAFLNAQSNLYQVKKTGESVLLNDGSFYDLLANPHPLQPQHEFWDAFYKNYAIFNRVHVYKSESTGFGVNRLMVLPSVNVTVTLKDNVDYNKLTDVNDAIDYYEFDKGDGYIVKYQPEQIWTFQGTSLNTKDYGLFVPENPFKPIESKLATKIIINDIRNELLGNHGAMGILSPDIKDADGSVPLLPKERDEIQQAYQNYGITKDKYKLIISNHKVDFTAISLPIADLLLTEFEDAADKAIVNNFSFPLSLLTAESKYQNQDSGNKELYENKIISEAKLFAGSLNAEFNFKGKGLKFEFDFSHIAVLQSDQKELADRNKTNTEIIVTLNKAVFDKTMSKETAINTLVFQGMNEGDAQNLIQ